MLSLGSMYVLELGSEILYFAYALVHDQLEFQYVLDTSTVLGCIFVKIVKVELEKDGVFGLFE